MDKLKRRLKEFRPKQKKKEKILSKQMVYDLAHKINNEVGAFLVMREESGQDQVDHAHYVAKNTLIKYGAELIALTHEVGGSCPAAAAAFLDSVDVLLHASNHWIDDAMITQYYDACQTLEKELILSKDKLSA